MVLSSKLMTMLHYDMPMLTDQDHKVYTLQRACLHVAPSVTVIFIALKNNLQTLLGKSGDVHGCSCLWERLCVQFQCNLSGPNRLEY